MSSDWLQPTVADVYTSWDTALQARADSQAKMFDDGVTWTNLRTGTLRWNSTNDRWEKWNGSTWANLSVSLTGTLKAANNLSDLASPTTARANLLLGSIAVENSPLAVTKGGTGATSIASAQSNLGLGTICTQNASAVSISGGTLSGITALTLTSGSTLSFTSSGSIQHVGSILNGGDIILQTQVLDYWLYLGSAGNHRVVVNSNGQWPYADNTYNSGLSTNRWSSVYATRLRSGQISHTSAIAIQISDVTKWVFDDNDFSFRPNVSVTYNLGSSSYLWDQIYVRNLNGPQTAIHLGDGGGDQHIRYIANTTGDHKFYTTAGSEEVYRIESTGKLYPVKVGRFDYSINWTGWVDNSRTMPPTGSGAPTLTELSNIVGTMIADFVKIGLFV